MPSISDMLEHLSESSARVDSFNQNADEYMDHYGLSEPDKQIVLDYIAESPGEPEPFIEEYAPDLEDNPILVGIIC